MGKRGYGVLGWFLEAGTPAAETNGPSLEDVAYRQSIEQALNPAPLRPATYDSVPEAAAWMIERASALQAEIDSGALDVSLHPPEWVSAVHVLATIDDVAIPSYGRGPHGGITY